MPRSLARLLKRLSIVFLIGIVIFLVAAQLASGVFLKPILEREGRRIFRVPVSIEKAGANLFDGSVWMKGVRVKNVDGFTEPDVLTARTVAIDIRLLSLLTSEFVIDRILLKDPVITVEIDGAGNSNLTQLRDAAVHRFRKFVLKKRKLVHLITRYELEKFAIRRGTIQLVDRRQSERDWTFGTTSFSIARVVYPPDEQEALPVALYLNTEVQGEEEGQIILLGRFNPFANKKSFDVTGSGKNIVMSEYNHFLSDFPIRFSEGLMQFKVKAVCHDDQVDLHQQVNIKGLQLGLKDLNGAGNKLSQLAFGLPPETIVNYFNDLWPKDEPVAFDFTVTGDLGAPDFDLAGEVVKGVRDAVYDRVTEKMTELVEATKQIADDAIHQVEADIDLAPTEPATVTETSNAN